MKKAERRSAKRKTPVARKLPVATSDLKKENAELKRKVKRLQQEQTATADALKAITADLTVALEHQTATSEILSSISGSITDAQPVFEAIARNLRRLFGTRFAVVQLLHDGMVHVVSRQVMKRNPKPGGGTIRARWGTTLQAASPCCRSRSSSLHRRLQTQRRRR